MRWRSSSQIKSAWLTQAQMAEWFQTTGANVSMSMHIRNVFAQRESCSP